MYEGHTPSEVAGRLDPTWGSLKCRKYSFFEDNLPRVAEVITHKETREEKRHYFDTDAVVAYLSRYLFWDDCGRSEGLLYPCVEVSKTIENEDFTCWSSYVYATYGEATEMDGHPRIKLFEAFSNGFGEENDYDEEDVTYFGPNSDPFFTKLIINNDVDVEIVFEWPSE